MSTKIFSIIGSTYPLDRLTKELDLLAEDKKYKIIAQIGESSYLPKNITYKKFFDSEEIKQKMKWADVIVSHAGAGSIIDLLTANKKFVLFPRLKKFGEAVDDHQIELCKAFGKKYGIKYTENEKELIELLKETTKPKIKKDSKLVNEIKKLV
ncbi:MAG: glycosyltransferase [archaeon]|jgi:UDP-N-acetylglucosamine transferase subunit ALG13